MSVSRRHNTDGTGDGLGCRVHLPLRRPYSDSTAWFTSVRLTHRIIQNICAPTTGAAKVRRVPLDNFLEMLQTAVGQTHTEQPYSVGTFVAAFDGPSYALSRFGR